jgi:hypothetical protein
MLTSPKRYVSHHQYVANGRIPVQMVESDGEVLEDAGCSLINHVSVMGQHVFGQPVLVVNIAVMTVA